jgi:hypothetical protein
MRQAEGATRADRPHLEGAAQVSDTSKVSDTA